MKAYVINLPRSRIRRDHMVAQLQDLDMSYEVIPATDGSLLTAAERECLVSARAVAASPSWLIPGVVGCALSHLDAYRAIAADGAACGLVLEDDAVLPPDTKALLATLEPALRASEVALLYVRNAGECRLRGDGAIVLHGDRRLLYPVEQATLTSAVAYVITRDACLSMIDFVVPVRAAPDCWGFFVEQGALDRVGCVLPRPFATRTDFKSTIDYLGSSTSPLQRLMLVVSERRIFPLTQLAAWRRTRTERRQSSFSIEP